MSRRLPKLCTGSADCTNVQPCPVHAREPWESSTRRERTVSGWEQQRRAERVMRQHHGICHVCHQPDADQVDHVLALEEGGADDEANLRPIHARPCHADKTQAEAARARARKR